ncbi:MAG: AI-2E family transporter [Clostridiales Family XIII bacterium]|jgi:predicted PurR-regulated permease PerM|nr:AI-2E family transporter [Clostridiales Family XIII bacterium]
MELNKATVKKILFLIAAAMFFLWIVLNFGTAIDVTGYIIGLFMPFFIGCCMAFILNVLMKFIENRAFGRITGGKIWSALRRPVSLLLTLILVLGILVFVSAMIIPTLRDTVATLMENAPGYLASLGQWASEYASRLGIEDVVKDVFNFRLDGDDVVERIWSFLTGAGSLVAKNAAGVVAGVFSGMTNFILGLIFAIYILLTKERLGAQFTRLISVYLPRKHGTRILDVATLSRGVFERFVAGQCLEAVIIGTLAGLGSIAINSSFALMLGVVIGFSALIPVVGAIAGTMVGAFLLLMESPWQALAFIVFIIILQQLDNHIIYPKIIGKSIGLPGMWVLFAVLVGGSINGIMGIIIGVPLCSVLYSLLCRDVRARETSAALRT